MALLRPLVAHHRRSRPGTGEVGAGRHVTGVLRITGSLRIHLHLGLSGHAHVGTVGGLLLHHVSAHLWTRAVYKLTSLGTTNSNMLDVGAHAVLRHLHLLRVSWHWLRLRTIHKRRHLTRRRLD